MEVYYMREIRKLEKAVKQYERLLIEDPNDAKENKEIYINDLKLVMDYMEDYIDDMSEKYQIWCDTSVDVFEAPTNNIFLRIKRAVDMYIVNYYLNKFSKMMSNAGILQTKLEKIKERFIQYQYLT